MVKSFSCSSFRIEDPTANVYPKNHIYIVNFIFQLNHLAAIFMPGYALSFNYPVKYPHSITDRNIPLSAYCCYVSTLVSKHFLDKFYEDMTDIKVVNGIYRGLGWHSWLEFKYKGNSFIFDTKPYFQGLPCMYNFATPSVGKFRRKIFVQVPVVLGKGRTEEYQHRFELADYVINELEHIGVNPDGVNQRKFRMKYKRLNERVMDLKRTWNYTHHGNGISLNEENEENEEDASD